MVAEHGVASDHLAIGARVARVARLAFVSRSRYCVKIANPLNLSQPPIMRA
jgi:hypothetical protein